MFTKRINLRILVLSLLLSTLVFSFGCSKDDEDSNPLSSRESGFVGTWVLTKVTFTDTSGPHIMTPEEAGIMITIKANSDKTFETVTTMEGETQTNAGIWSLNGDIIVLISEGDTEFLPYTVDGNKFTIEITEIEDDIENSRILEFTKQ